MSHGKKLNKRSAEQVKSLMLRVLRKNSDWISDDKLQEWCGRIDAKMKKQIIAIWDREEGGWDDLPTDMLAITYLELWALKIQGGYLFYRNPAENGQYQRMAGGELWSESFVSDMVAEWHIDWERERQGEEQAFLEEYTKKTKRAKARRAKTRKS
jgi:hypothetical protein